MLQEVLEETGLDISKINPKFLKKVYVKDPQKDFIYHIFTCELRDEPKTITLAPDEHIEYKWIDKKIDLENLPMIKELKDVILNQLK